MISIVVTHMPVNDEMFYLTQTCVLKLRENTINPFELIIVSNGLITKSWNEDILVVNKENRGNAKAWDMGINVASNNVIVLMDNDVWVEKNWDKEMVEKLSDDNVGVTFPYSILGTDDYRATDYRGRKDGFCFAFNWDVYDMCGPFLQDQPFHSYYEDDNFFMNVMDKGLNLVACKNSKVFHKGQGTTKKILNKEVEDGIESNRKWFNDKWNGEIPYLTK